MKRKLSFLLPFVILLTAIFSAESVLAYYKKFKYSYDTTLRGGDRMIKSQNDIVFVFDSYKCRKGKKMRVDIRHNVSWGRDTLLSRKWIPECGGKVVNYGHKPNIPIYIVLSKKNDGYWVKGKGKIYTQKR
ncbi:hypothetical protein ACFFJY_14125 [Fictibacillus aquaticus]|uniref:Uncharacterized protein n=1 Tax=Fictibacillus aquaticus TaxID=2021314 RepID=A0A235FF08_9BACL|nr:hypothetical protein [Fictibacillus aquaticus]OYD59355.1 hypothetical protein CGZ90_05550 [Fictibacillus aquaticus]